MEQFQGVGLVVLSVRSADVPRDEEAYHQFAWLDLRVVAVLQQRDLLHRVLDHGRRFCSRSPGC
jgi:hypothetical protein